MVFVQASAELSSARERARHIGAVLGPGTRELVARMATAPRAEGSGGGGGGGDGDDDDGAGVCLRTGRERGREGGTRCHFDK